MKLSRSSYPIMFAIILLLIRLTIGQFSEELEKQLFLPLLVICSILIIIGLILAIKDKELFHTVTDERTKKVDRSAGYYSWWFTIIFVFIFGAITFIKEFTTTQYTYVIVTEMFLTMLLFHMYFNFKGEV